MCISTFIIYVCSSIVLVCMDSYMTYLFEREGKCSEITSKLPSRENEFKVSGDRGRIGGLGGVREWWWGVWKFSGEFNLIELAWDYTR